jgi:nucleolar protein 14
MSHSLIHTQAWQGRSDDEDDGLPGYDVSTHFGGGDAEDDLFRLKPRDGREGESRDEPGDGELEEGAPAAKRTKAEVMEELIAKSKAFRAAKQHQREEDVEETEALDKAFRELGAAGALAGLVRPKNDKLCVGGIVFYLWLRSSAVLGAWC